ncbi:MAG: hypothetical protein HYU39_00950 [Thaumarchaeota archaeon]|nr:hypothetical protein [Nitrososphaerota archaeon]
MSLTQTRRAVAICKWCGRRLGTEYYYRCKTCGATYCYVHSSKHEHGDETRSWLSADRKKPILRSKA